MTASGTSLSTPFTAGALALAWSQHPDATANQMIQALFRTTGGTTHGLQRDDEAGYGLVNPERMLTVDPTTFPDDNPMLFDEQDRSPVVADVLAATSTPTPEATPTRAPLADTGSSAVDTGSSADDAGDSAGTPVGLIAGIAGAAAVALILTVVLIGRRRTEPANSNDSGEN
jgi:subtilisin family serine protease